MAHSAHPRFRNVRGWMHLLVAILCGMAGTLIYRSIWYRVAGAGAVIIIYGGLCAWEALARQHNGRIRVLRCASPLTLLFLLLSCAPSRTAVAPSEIDPHDYIRPHDFLRDGSAHEYLALAVSLQELEPAERAAELANLSVTPARAHYVYALCRMLFVARAGQTFRAPMLGSPTYVAAGEWPLTPITVHHDVPIVVATGYSLGGRPESPLLYVIYCLTECDWSARRWKNLSPPQIRAAIESFIAEMGIEDDDAAAFLRRQAP